ncbi:FG-GAP repeat protein [Photobacterium sp. TY1-4]|uniref:FG-GAP repeat protein n=1 Tax=Photobacterium sp. TY1-4 TaxID=2899122 RepID=UPI0021C1D16F|nr:FG-GAP repeat protein [Photobacterium sp. TY1-4]UXI00199.1 FG-GAP repeat protein [Photobacterium sp. TY1-4]
MKNKNNPAPIVGLPLLTTLLLTACGGGGDDSTPRTQPDPLPSAFNFQEITALTTQKGSINFAWQAAERAKYYQLCIADTTNDSNCSEVATTDQTELTLSARAVKAIQGHPYFIRAVNTSGVTDSNRMSLPVSELVKITSAFEPTVIQKNSVYAESVTMSADGTTLAVAAPFEDKGTGLFFDQQMGAVYVYQRDNEGNWQEPVRITATNGDGFDWFGVSISLSDNGKTLAVGASGESSTSVDDPTVNATDGVGAVYIFEQSGVGTWQEKAYLKSASSLDTFDFFGHQVKLSGSGKVLAVTATGHDAATADAPQENHNSGRDSGGLYLFERQPNGNWAEKQYLKGSYIEANEGYGYSLAIDYSGSQVAVGMPYFVHNYKYGHVSTYSRNAQGIWQLSASLRGEREPVAQFGAEVDMDSDGRTLVISMPGWRNTNFGKVYVYHRDDANRWQFTSEVASPQQDNTNSFSQYGLSLSQNGRVLAVGATASQDSLPDQPNTPLENVGAVHIYTLDAQQNWQFGLTLKANEIEENAFFGHTVDLNEDGTTIAVGASGYRFRDPMYATTVIPASLNSRIVVY